MVRAGMVCMVAMGCQGVVVEPDPVGARGGGGSGGAVLVGGAGDQVAEGGAGGVGGADGASCSGDCGACGSCVDGACAPVVAGELCRFGGGPCNAADYCDGSSLVCPEDRPLPDGSAPIGGDCDGHACDGTNSECASLCVEASDCLDGFVCDAGVCAE